MVSWDRPLDLLPLPIPPDNHREDDFVNGKAPGNETEKRLEIEL